MAKGNTKGKEKKMETLGTHYVVKTAGANMPASCWGKYGRVAVLEIADTLTVADIDRIDARSKKIVSVVRTWEKRHIGKTSRCAFQIALKEARELAEALNKADQVVAKIKKELNK